MGEEQDLTQFLKIIRQKKPDLRPASVRSYLSILRSFLYEGNSLDSPSDIMGFINEPDSAFSRKTRASHLLTWLRVLDAPDSLVDMLLKKLSELNQEVEKTYNSQNGTKVQKERGGAFVDWDKILKQAEEEKKRVDELIDLEELKPVQFRNLRNSLLVQTQIYTRLRRDLNSIIARFHGSIENKPLTDKIDFARRNHLNFYDKMNGRFYIFNHKQSNKTGEPIVSNIENDELVKDLRKWIDGHLSANASLLFPMTGHDKDRLHPMKKDTISALIRKRVFADMGVSGGTTAIRHSFLSDYYKPDEKGLREMEELASSMGHTPRIAMRYALRKQKKRQ